MPNTELRTILETQIKAAEDDIARLRAALSVLEDQNDPESPKRVSATPAVKPTTKTVPLGKIIKTITESPGITTTSLAKETGGDQTKILALLKEQEGEQVRREGQRRATRWFVLNDADQTANRAAAQPKQRKTTRKARSKAKPAQSIARSPSRSRD